MTIKRLFVNVNKFKVYITDPGMATYFSIDLMSHVGTQPKLKPDEKSTYDVRMKMEDTRNPGQENLCQQSPDYSFEDCVDEYIQTDLTEVQVLILF